MAEKIIKNIDWLLVFFIIPITLFGLLTMRNFTDPSGGAFFPKQVLWLAISLVVFFGASFIDFRFLKQTKMIVFIYLFFTSLLLFLFILGKVTNGAQSWFDFGFFSFQPVDMMKLALIILLAKYFSRRHVEIKNIKHVLISSLYMFVPFILVFLQPDFGSAMVIFFIWFGMVLVSGISKKHIAFVFITGILAFLALWIFVFAPYQKDRIKTFIDPLSNIHGAGYNVFQSTIAVGSGQIVGKGLGFGSQSRLSFLPEPETDFIFAAFSEEWGFVGSFILIVLFCLIIWRILNLAYVGSTNFETLYALGFAIFLISHIVVNVGMNLGIFPVTGIPLPFMSYGGSHLLTEFLGLGILMSMRRYSRPAHRDDMKNEFLGF